NEENELIPTRLVTGWRICIDYRKLNEATRKDHFPLPFIDQMLERLAGNEYYCFLDGFSRCMLAIFYDMFEKTMEVFMDDFSVFGNSFKNCLSRLDKMLQTCDDTNLCLNWEKSHFMVKEGIVLGHKISKNRTEVDKEKVDLSTFSKLATMDPQGDILVLTSPPRRSLMPDSFGPPSTRMPTSSSKIVTRANDKENFHNVMRCLKTPSKFMKSLTFRALTLWAHSRLHEGTHIFSWLSIICRNGLKRKRSPLMTTELFASSFNLSSPDLVPLELS
nr:DNA-directed DNA polymerase [Tanacetum cinerariifolium]